MIQPITCQPLGIYRNAETLRRCRRVAMSSNPSWVTLSFQTDRSPCPLLTVSLETKQARELLDYLRDWLNGEGDESKGGGI
jgi:hypothetical protein